MTGEMIVRYLQELTISTGLLPKVKSLSIERSSSR